MAIEPTDYRALETMFSQQIAAFRVEIANTYGLTLTKHDKVLFGTDGAGGLVDDVRNTNRANRWILVMLALIFVTVVVCVVLLVLLWIQVSILNVRVST
jgi:hypothetical protein